MMRLRPERTRQQRHFLRIFLTGIAILAAVAFPLLLSILLAHNLATEAEAALLHSYAHNLSRRADATADQVSVAFTRLAAVPGADKCSDTHLTAMRNTDLASSKIQAVGYVADGELLCSSQGLPEALPVGPVDFVTAGGWNVRLNQTFAFVPDASFVMIEGKGWAAIINKALLLDTLTEKPDVLLALANPKLGRLFAERGKVPASWLQRYARKPTVPDQMFLADGYMVAFSESPRYRSLGIAASPYDHLQARTRKAALVMVPIGLVLGLGLGTGTFYLLQRQQSLRIQLRNAIRNNEFSIVYQPAVDLKTRRWTGAEALLRWKRRDGSSVSPDIFIPLAESSGMIREVTDQLFKIVAQEAGAIFAWWPDFRLALNVAAEDLERGDLADRIQHLCKRVGTSPGNISIELTERSLINDKNARHFLEPIRKAGIRVVIDDFGTGYSSLAYLQTFEIDGLKIDKSFMHTIGSTTQTTEVLDHVISLAKSLGLRMIAEGVEAEAEAAYLEAWGVHVAQGWLFARPMSRDALLAGLR